VIVGVVDQDIEDHPTEEFSGVALMGVVLGEAHPAEDPGKLGVTHLGLLPGRGGCTDGGAAEMA
jgi:hypothetical protein